MVDDSRWPLDYDALIKAIDGFCARLRPDRGDRLEIRRDPMGEAVTWVFLLDQVEIGSFAVCPGVKGGYEQSEHATAITRGAEAHGVQEIPQIERERHEIFSSIMRDLEYHLELEAGIREPGGRLRRRRVFRSELPGDAEDETSKGGRPRLEDLPEDEKEQKREKVRNYLKRIESGCPKDVAARMEGRTRKTLERWRERLLD